MTGMCYIGRSWRRELFFVLLTDLRATTEVSKGQNVSGRTLRLWSYGLWLSSGPGPSGSGFRLPCVSTFPPHLQSAMMLLHCSQPAMD